jgi:hypothetical protein
MGRLAFLLGVSALAACSTVPERPALDGPGREASAAAFELVSTLGEGDHVCEADGATLRYVGGTELSLAECLEAHQQATRLIITSYGGPVRDAVPAARMIRERGMAVDVLGPCISSCGNYVFPAGSPSSVLPYSAVLLHGAPSADIERLREDLRRAFAEAGIPEELITEIYVERQLEAVVADRRLHEGFAEEFGVGDAFYTLDFAGASSTENTLVGVSPDFAADCLTRTRIGTFWYPETPEEEAALRETAVLDLTLIGYDIAAPDGC